MTMRLKPLGVGVLLLVPAVALPGGRGVPPKSGPPPAAAGPRLEPVAETKLLMEGLALPNFRGLEKILRQKSDDAAAWKFARGQALLIAETANLIMLRPPRSASARAAWFARAADLRGAARELARTIAARDYERSRANLVKLANVCNRCHQSFRRPVEIVPFEEQPPPK
jgi:hypothetical protein